MAERHSRDPRVAGSFYPGTRQALGRMLSDLFEGAVPAGTAPEAALGAVVPHAG